MTSEFKREQQEKDTYVPLFIYPILYMMFIHPTKFHSACVK